MTVFTETLGFGQLLDCRFSGSSVKGIARETFHLRCSCKPQVSQIDKVGTIYRSP